MAGGLTEQEKSPLGASAVFATLGLAFTWQLFRHACVLVAMPVSQADCSLGVDVWMALYYALIGLFALAAGVFARQAGRVWTRAAMLVVCVAASCAVCAGALLPDGLVGFGAIFSQFVVAMLLAISTVLLASYGLRVFTSQMQANPTLATSCVLASSFLSIVITFVLGDIFSINLATAVVSPVLAAGCFWMAGVSPESGCGRVAAAMSAPAVRSKIVGTVALLIAATLAKAFFDAAVGPVGEQGRMVKHIVGIVEVAGVMVLSFACANARRFAMSATYVLLCSLVLGIGVIASCTDNLLHTGVATVVSARVLAESAVFALCAMYCASVRANTLKVCCLALLVPEMLACLIGYGGCALLPSLGIEPHQLLVPVSVALMAAVSLVTFTVSFKRQLCRADALPDGPSLSEMPAQELVESRDCNGYRDDADVSVESFEALASRFSLTPRETDIARHLYAGHSAKRISEMECLSINTVQTHSRTLYRKLGIHSRQELGDLIEGRRGKT